MPILPGTILSWVNQQFTDGNGDPLALGSVAFKVTGTNDDKDTFTDAGLQTANQNPLPLDADGWPSGGSGTIFCEPGGYDIFIYDANNVLIRSIEGYEDAGQTFLSQMGQLEAEGEKDAPDDYVFTDDDITSTLLPVTTGFYYMPQVTARTQRLNLVNKSTSVDAILNPNGSDTFNGQAGTFTIPAGSANKFSGASFLPDIANSDWILVSYWES